MTWHFDWPSAIVGGVATWVGAVALVFVLPGIQWPWEAARDRRREVERLRTEVDRRTRFAADIRVVAPRLFEVLSMQRESIVWDFYSGFVPRAEPDWDYEHVHRLAQLARTHDDDMAALELLREGGFR